MSAASEARKTRSRQARASYTPSRMASCSRVMPRCAARRERGTARQRGASHAVASASRTCRSCCRFSSSCTSRTVCALSMPPPCTTERPKSAPLPFCASRLSPPPAARARHGRPPQRLAAAAGAAAGRCAGGVRAASRRPAAGLVPAGGSADASARRKNYYDVLQVAKSADDASIKRAYRKLAVKYHPVRRASRHPPPGRFAAVQQPPAWSRQRRRRGVPPPQRAAWPDAAAVRQRGKTARVALSHRFRPCYRPQDKNQGDEAATARFAEINNGASQRTRSRPPQRRSARDTPAEPPHACACCCSL